ncbi:MAG: hypothetical protein APU95_05675 [Hadesarchaea archaeon YNP_N21]|jgi:hypothetical protein|nr:MAG: hypothetical protein APU95_05675 [Hadesarchaea archaeon YNP_N21]
MVPLNNYRALLEEYLNNELNRKYSAGILNRLLQQRFRKGMYVIGRGSQAKRFSEMDLYTKSFEVCDSLVAYVKRRGYDASVVPTMISSDLAPNFRIRETLPDEGELWRFLFLLVTGLHYREFVVNLDKVSPEITKAFRRALIRDEYLIFRQEFTGLNVQKMLSDLKVPKMPLKEEFIFSFLVLTYFIKFWKYRKQYEELLETLPSNLRMKEYPPVTDDATLVVFSLPREKKQMFIFPRLQSLIARWFKDDSDDVPSVAKFVFSLYIPDKKYRDKSLGILNKFLYYLLRNEVNGDLLNKLIVDKLSFELKREEKPYGIISALQFLRSLEFYSGASRTQTKN